MASNLSNAEFYKYEWRAEVFLKMYSAKTPFELVDGKKVTFRVDQGVIKAVKAKLNVTPLKLTDDKGNSYKFSDLKKNKDFGGKGEGSGTAVEDRELQSLINQIEAAKKKERCSTIKIKVGTKTYDVFTAVTTPGTPKSDFHLIDINGNELVWISHKKGSTPKDFQQWGGISARGEPKIFAHPEVQTFIEDLKRIYPDGLPRATTVYRKIKDNKLKMLSVYGNEFDSGRLGRQNTTILLQGPVRLVKTSNVYHLSANNVHLNGESITGGFEPVLMAIYKGDRSDAGVKGTRIGISPIQSRKGVEIPAGLIKK